MANIAKHTVKYNGRYFKAGEHVPATGKVLDSLEESGAVEVTDDAEAEAATAKRIKAENAVAAERAEKAAGQAAAEHKKADEKAAKAADEAK